MRDSRWRAGTPVVPVFMVRQGDTIHHKIKIMPQIEIVKTRDREECVRETRQRFTNSLEQIIASILTIGTGSIGAGKPDRWAKNDFLLIAAASLSSR